MEPKELIKEKLDIAEIIGDYVQLKPAGSGSFKGLCPFHTERSPSFHVSRERQIYKCFGCDKGGDIFSFVMEMEGMSFPEALRHLGKRAGVEIPEFRPQASGVQEKRDRMLAMYDDAASYYALVLREYPHGSAARAYVASRNIPPELQEQFRLGASPDGWDALSLFLKKKGYTESELVEGGLSLRKKTGDGVFDRFRNRLMIPIANAQGQVIAFTGRIIPGTSHAEEGGKYVNSPETLLFKKSDALFGLHLAKQGIRKAGEVIIVEGNLDVLASHKAGVTHVIASSGTALTESQLHQLMRYTKRMVFCLDDDSAGFAAAKRALDLALHMQEQTADACDVRCLVIPEGAGKDPDDIVQKDPQAWRDLSAHSVSIVEYVFQKTFRMFHVDDGTMSVDDRKALIDELVPYISRITRPDEQHLYLLRIADATHVSLEVLRSMLIKRGTSPQGVLPPAQKAQIPNAPVARPTQETQAHAFLFAHALSDPSMIEAILAKMSDRAPADPWGQLYGFLNTVYTSPEFRETSLGKTISPFSQLRTYLTSIVRTDLLQVIDDAVLFYDEIVVGLSQSQKQEEARRHLLLLARTRKEEQKKSLEAAIRQAELASDSSLLARLLNEYSVLLSELRKTQ